jgi:2-polyprenyl-6-methoxyphenol hydroxylase-like FAD-dependent oxidoreductase
MSQVIVVGAGPAGASLAYVLAQRGVEVTLLERQRDFAREFRGEVLLPGGIEALEQLGLGEVLARTPRSDPEAIAVYLNRELVLSLSADPDFFGGRPPAPLSQPALLEGIAAEAEKLPGFRLLRGSGVRDLLHDEDGRISGVRAQTDQGPIELRAPLVVGADGRASMVRRRGGFRAAARDLPMDIVWCKLPEWEPLRGARAYLGRGHLLIAYRSWDGRTQVAWAILKGTFGELRRRGIEHWVEEMAEHVSPDLGAHLRESLSAISQPFLLDCQADCVERWSAPGALLIGDAAHVMSPVGGQGLNIALRDAVVAANQLVPALRAGEEPDALDAACARVEAQRLPEVAAVQRLQALPPRVVLQRAWWGEPLRRLFAGLLRRRFVQRLALRPAGMFVFGAGEVRLEV